MTDDLKFLAFDTSTDMMSVAVSRGAQTWHHHGVGGPHASAQLIPVIQDLLSQAKMSLNELTALVMGHGPVRSRACERPVLWRKGWPWVPT